MGYNAEVLKFERLEAEAAAAGGGATGSDAPGGGGGAEVAPSPAPPVDTVGRVRRPLMPPTYSPTIRSNASIVAGDAVPDHAAAGAPATGGGGGGGGSHGGSSLDSQWTQVSMPGAAQSPGEDDEEGCDGVAQDAAVPASP